MPGAPVKLRLTVQASHLRADRSGLALLQVDALDSKGEAVPYIHPIIDWHISGEGKFVGPEKYTSDTDKNGAESGSFYIVLPTANIVRTTDTAGEIRVSVTSPGLEPAEIVLHSTAAASLSGEGIEQPQLSDTGRAPVMRDNSIVSSRPDTPPRVFDLIGQDYRLPAATPAQARASLDEFLHDHNPKLPKDTPAYEDALTKLSNLLAENRGKLIADWYNFTANQYEEISVIDAAIERSHVPFSFEHLLEKDYADRILLKGEAVDTRQEAKQLSSFLSGAHVVTTGGATGGVEHTSASTLGDLLKGRDANWATLDTQHQRRFLDRLYHFNPTLRVGGKPSLNTPLPAGPIALPAELE